MTAMRRRQAVWNLREYCMRIMMMHKKYCLQTASTFRGFFLQTSSIGGGMTKCIARRMVTSITGHDENSTLCTSASAC
jgi:hypothetical protein